jgi:DNA-binding transcriptional MerR regulator
MKYLTTLEVAHELKVSKQTLLTWLYQGKVPEPPRNRRGYRLWSASRVHLVKKLIQDGRLHRRTVLYQDGAPELLSAYAREVRQFLKESGIGVDAFLREMGRLDPGFRKAARRLR